MARKREHVVEILGAPKLRDGVRLCDAPGCEETGDFRAPRSREQLDRYYWFCMEHVRAYNSRWNFYAGMSQAQIEMQIRADTTWWRPTWPLGSNGGRRDRMRSDRPEIDLGIFGDEDWDRDRVRSGHANGSGWRPRPGSNEAEALAVLDLDPPVTREDVKARYKALVKRYHPDANGGNRDAEERLKVINRTYSVLRSNTDF